MSKKKKKKKKKFPFKTKLEEHAQLIKRLQFLFVQEIRR